MLFRPDHYLDFMIQRLGRDWSRLELISPPITLKNHAWANEKRIITVKWSALTQPGSFLACLLCAIRVKFAKTNAKTQTSIEATTAIRDHQVVVMTTQAMRDLFFAAVKYSSYQCRVLLMFRSPS